MTRNGLIVRARGVQEGTYVISSTGKGSGKRKRGWRLRHCGDALSTSSSLIACTVRFASRSPWKPAEKPIDSLFGLLWKRTLSRIPRSLSAPLLSSPNLSRLRQGEAFSSPTGLLDSRASFAVSGIEQEEARRRRRRRRRRKRRSRRRRRRRRGRRRRRRRRGRAKNRARQRR